MNRRTFHTLALGAGASVFSQAPTLSGAAGGGKPIRAGQIGTKHAHASGQLEMLRACADYEVVGVVEPDEELRKKAEKDKAYAGVTWMTEEQLLNTPGLQLVSVETGVGDLLNTAEKVVNAGMHLHLDKPAGESLEQFKRILDTTTAKKRLVKMGYMFRYNSGFDLAVKAVREGWLGDISVIHAEMSKFMDDEGRAAMLPYKGGSMFELGCHVIDSVVRILGKPEKVSPHIQRGKDGWADNMLAVLDYPKATATVRSSMIEVQGGARRQFVVCGNMGTVEILQLDAPTVRLMLDRPRGEYKKGIQTVKVPNLPRYAADWVDFAKAIRGEKAWEFTPEHDLAVQETVLRASGMM
ncbi:Gfo/Idh/MocA family oxidoreductase [Roseimicrobium sp. ORNL1]|uniref:Gfo/Idh/MocA family protein n=1 Tax=Roseimicrobium sp. ORNL1 TaxID=2711231 RepID=UPI0013E14C9F|nr:Gfo/Idh/MocA family oxidoreductase [Roseimicrobium sp. ORNL1]QIF01829.1 Gfo/Idh/MocA family oxidoreductase [Roseimicrobium sp. ORNL1]